MPFLSLLVRTVGLPEHGAIFHQPETFSSTPEIRDCSPDDQFDGVARNSHRTLKNWIDGSVLVKALRKGGICGC